MHYSYLPLINRNQRLIHFLLYVETLLETKLLFGKYSWHIGSPMSEAEVSKVNAGHLKQEVYSVQLACVGDVI